MVGFLTLVRVTATVTGLISTSTSTTISTGAAEPHTSVSRLSSRILPITTIWGNFNVAGASVIAEKTLTRERRVHTVTEIVTIYATNASTNTVWVTPTAAQSSIGTSIRSTVVASIASPSSIDTLGGSGIVNSSVSSTSIQPVVGSAFLTSSVSSSAVVTLVGSATATSIEAPSPVTSTVGPAIGTSSVPSESNSSTINLQEQKAKKGTVKENILLGFAIAGAVLAFVLGSLVTFLVMDGSSDNVVPDPKSAKEERSGLRTPPRAYSNPADQAMSTSRNFPLNITGTIRHRTPGGVKHQELPITTAGSTNQMVNSENTRTDKKTDELIQEETVDSKVDGPLGTLGGFLIGSLTGYMTGDRTLLQQEQQQDDP